MVFILFFFRIHHPILHPFHGPFFARLFSQLSLGSWSPSCGRPNFSDVQKFRGGLRLVRSLHEMFASSDVLETVEQATERSCFTPQADRRTPHGLQQRGLHRLLQELLGARCLLSKTLSATALTCQPPFSPITYRAITGFYAFIICPRSWWAVVFSAPNRPPRRP